MGHIKGRARRRSVATAATFAVAAVAGVAGGKLTGKVTLAWVVFAALVAVGMLVTYWVDREAKESGPPPAEHVNQVQGKQHGHGNIMNILFINNPRRHIGQRAAITLLAVVAVLAVGVPVTAQRLLEDHGNTSGKPAPNTVPVPAASSSPPILVESVTELKSISGNGSLALPKPLLMSSSELATFNKTVIPNSSIYSQWYASHDAAAVDFGVTTVTLRGNARESVHIANMKVLKNCGAPVDGTYFQGYSQGSGATVRVGFNLDAPDPIPQQMAEGMVPLGVNFFDEEYIALAPGETITLAIGAFTKHYACSFRLQMIVATSYGTFSEVIDNHGKSFIVTAKAAPALRGMPYSGYQSAYAYIVPNGTAGSWQQINPATYKQ